MGSADAAVVLTSTVATVIPRATKLCIQSSPSAADANAAAKANRDPAFSGAVLRSHELPGLRMVDLTAGKAPLRSVASRALPLLKNAVLRKSHALVRNRERI